MRRSVFQTDLAKDASGEQWRAHGALEVGIQNDDSQIKHKIILYRAPGGDIRDITEEVQVSLTKEQSGSVIQVSKNLPSAEVNLPKSQVIGFNIKMTALDSDSAAFEGSFASYKDQAVTTSSWRGSFIAYRDTPLNVIRAGRQPLPDDVCKFLDTSPLSSSKDNVVQDWADTLLSELSLHVLPSKLKSFFFSGLKEPGGRFASDVLHGSLPGPLSGSLGPYLALRSILNDNQRFFFFLGMHVLCRDLKQAEWFESEFKNCVQDKVEPFFKMVTAPPNTGSDTLEQLKNAYNASLPAAKELDTLRHQYTDAINRCYYAAYVCHQPSWITWLNDAESFFQKFRGVLLSDTYKEHWLLTLAQVTSDPGAIPLKAQLALLGDKLVFLKVMASKNGGNTADMSQVSELLSTLASYALQTGLVRDSLINPSPTRMTLNPQLIMDEEYLKNLNMINAMNYSSSGGRMSNEIFPGQVESMAVHHWLKDDAKPLGLYTWEFSCVVM
jgi:hypothetical protein